MKENFIKGMMPELSFVGEVGVGFIHEKEEDEDERNSIPGGAQR